MAWLSDLLGKSPFGVIVEHSKKVYACVELIRQAAQAVMDERYDDLNQIHHEISSLEHEADQIKDEIRKILYSRLFISVSRDALLRFLSAQDDVADRAQDFVVVLTLRKTKMHPELRDEFMTFVGTVIEVAQSLLIAAQELQALAESSFAGKEATNTLEAIRLLGEKEWGADKLQRRFARHFYSLEADIDPITVMMYDKYCRKLGQVANAAETAGKYLRTMIEQA